MAKSVQDIDGDVAEVGVYKGGTAYLLSKALPHNTLHLFDTFSGMPETADAAIDYHKKGDFDDVNLGDVRKLLSSPNINFHVGFFPKTAEGLVDSTFSFVHIDCDIYNSVHDCCEFFFPRLKPHGIMIFDDYG